MPGHELVFHAACTLHMRGMQDLLANVAYLILLHITLMLRAGVSAIPESASGELRALESGRLSSQGGVDTAPEHAELGTQTSKGLEENTSSVA